MFWYLPKKKYFFFFFFPLSGKNLTFFHSPFSLNFAWLSAFGGYNIECKHSLHLESSLYCHFNEWIKRNLRFKKAG